MSTSFVIVNVINNNERKGNNGELFECTYVVGGGGDENK